MKIWLDDIRPAPNGWFWAKSCDEAWPKLFDPDILVTEVSLDHDLGENLPTGYDFVNVIEEMIGLEIWPKGLAIPVFHIHSANPVGRKNMERAINSIECLVR